MPAAPAPTADTIRPRVPSQRCRIQDTQKGREGRRGAGSGGRARWVGGGLSKGRGRVGWVCSSVGMDTKRVFEYSGADPCRQQRPVGDAGERVAVQHHILPLVQAHVDVFRTLPAGVRACVRVYGWWHVWWPRWCRRANAWQKKGPCRHKQAALCKHQTCATSRPYRFAANSMCRVRASRSKPCPFARK